MRNPCRLLCLPLRALLLLSLCCASLPAAAATDGEATTQAFYGWLLSRPHIAMPSAAQRKQLAAFMTPDLIVLLKKTAEAEARCIAATPEGFKPLLFEGSLLVGNYEGANEAMYGTWRRTKHAMSVDVDLMAIDDTRPKGHKDRAYRWRDRVTLRQVGGRWLISDLTLNVSSADRYSLVDYLWKYVRVESLTCGQH
ncbi:MAG: hypothetical protein JWP59_88 [Massilia sp.]|nr:hypothetical protein [Massilia sp.]